MQNDAEILNAKLLIFDKDINEVEHLKLTLSKYISDIVAISDYSIFTDELLKSPDIVLVHLHSDNVDMILSKIREVSEFMQIVVITDKDDINELYPTIVKYDVNRFLIKPIDETTLFNNIRKSIFKFATQEKNLKSQMQFISELLNISRNLLLITDGKRVTHVNSSFLNYAMCSTVKEFNERYPELDGLLINYETAFYNHKRFDEWVYLLLEDRMAQDYEHKKYMLKLKNLSVPNEPSTFIVDINRFTTSDDILLSLNDITDFENEKKYYKEIAQYDPLTSIYNRKRFNEELNKNMDIMLKYGIKVSLIMFDIDYFKKINDQYGHGTGDIILKEIVAIVKNSIRRADIFSRYGGEEFTIIMPDTNVRDAGDTAERIRRTFENYQFTEVEKVTCSFGVTDMKQGDTPETFLNRADKALYDAKKYGRNKVVTN